MIIIYIKSQNKHYLANSFSDIDTSRTEFSMSDIWNKTKKFQDSVSTIDVHNDENGRLYYEDSSGDWYWAVYDKTRTQRRVIDEHGLSHYVWNDVNEIDRIDLINIM